ncbi:MAG: exosome complex protein Rrp42 [Halobacteriota archaeon]|nr:exosome complex protein Rrp42 [Halobacteriota archaeon]
MDKEVVIEIQKDNIYNLIKKGERTDGRAFDEYREITIETGMVPKADGSARVKIGESQVVVGVKMQPGEPFPDTPDKGVLITNAELVPLASPSFESGPPNENSVEIARVVDRGIRESKAIDLSKICVEAGEKVWIVFVDIHVINDGGNLQDTAALGAIAALLTSKIPNIQYEMGDEDEQLPVREIPIAITAVEFDGEIVLDPNLYEENVATSMLTVISNTDGSICGMQRKGLFAVDEEHINSMVDLAIDKAKEIREKFLEI